MQEILFILFKNSELVHLNEMLFPRCLKMIAGRITTIKKDRIQLSSSQVPESPAHARTQWLVFASNHSSHPVFEDCSDKQFPEVYCNSAALMSPISMLVLRASSKTLQCLLDKLLRSLTRTARVLYSSCKFSGFLFLFGVVVVVVLVCSGFFKKYFYHQDPILGNLPHLPGMT